MAELPHMPVKVNDILGDAGHLPNAQFGAYCKLLFRWWAKGALPEKDEAKLAGWANTSVRGFQALKQFLKETDCGWIQNRLAVRYAECLAKSMKAQNSANAKNGANVDQRTLNERIANEYARRRVTIPLSIKDEALKEVEGADAPSPQKEKINTKKKSGDGDDAAFDFPMPDDPETRAIIERLAAIPNGAGRLRSLLLYDGRCGLERFGDEYLALADSQTKADLIDQRLGGALNEFVGKGRWKPVVRKLAA